MGGFREVQDSEVTLSPVCLLGIFLGLVLAFGALFGFGYSVGRRAIGGRSVPIGADRIAQRMPAAIVPIAKPSAVRTLATDDAAAPQGGSLSGGSDALLYPATAAPVTVPVSDAPAAREAADAAPAQQKASEGSPETGRIVVQVAAVVRREDADALVAALRQRGYRVMERNEPEDKLVHVQVGPFSSREGANAMKQRLLADGYNAIVEQ